MGYGHLSIDEREVILKMQAQQTSICVRAIAGGVSVAAVRIVAVRCRIGV